MTAANFSVNVTLTRDDNGTELNYDGFKTFDQVCENKFFSEKKESNSRIFELK